MLSELQKNPVGFRSYLALLRSYGRSLTFVHSTRIRSHVFDLFHNPTHPGAKVTVRISGKHYVRPSMRYHLSTWCKASLACQQSKVSWQNHVIPSHFTAPDGQCKHVLMDLIGPLLESDEYNFCLAMTDRFS